MAYLYETLRLIFDAIICDLPYGTTACSWDTIIPFEPLWENYKRLVKANGAVVLFGSQPFTSKLVMSNLEWFKYEWVWEKNISRGYNGVSIRPLTLHENILVFSRGNISPGNKGNIRYNPQGLKEYNKKNSRSKRGQTTGERLNLTNSYLQRYTNYPKSILKFDVAVGLHPTQKPVALLAYLIRTYTNPGEIILDNTMGSGTTLLAAQNEGRQAIGIEISEEYCKIAVDRLRQPSFFSIPDKPKLATPTQKELL
jgi:site-specific DNA-methyltransferase (adenine-specific)